METEFEVKILNINVAEIKRKLKAIGAKKLIERKMRRYVYDIDPKDKNTWIRLRDNGEKVTLTIKEIEHENIDGTKELEIEVDSFDKTNLLLNKLGFFHRAYQENKRISYKIGNVEVEIDFWPKIPPYLEIEGKSAIRVKSVVKMLGFDLSQTTSINTEDVYKKYGLNLHDFKELKF